MLDEIYLRLLLQLLPNELKLSSLEISRLLDQPSPSSEFARAYASLVKQIYLLHPDSDIGLRFGAHLHPSTLCDFSRLLMTSENFKALLGSAAHYHYIHGASYVPIVNNRPGTISLSLAFPYKRKIGNSQRRFCAEAVFSYVLNALRETICPSIHPRAVYFDFDPPPYAERYSEQFYCPVWFNKPLSLIEFDDDLLYRQLSTYNETLHQLYANKCLDLWKHSERLQNFEYRVISTIIQHHPISFSSQKLASKLNISVRGLQKRLNKHGESFSSLATLARRELAKSYLFQQHQSLEFTAERLGFQSTSGFRRFFKTEFDLSPNDFCKSP